MFEDMFSIGHINEQQQKILCMPVRLFHMTQSLFNGLGSGIPNFGDMTAQA